MTHRAWQEENDENALSEIRVLTVHLFDHAVLLTLRWRIPDTHNTDLINQETTFYASFEQAEDIANTILGHVKGKVS